MSEFEPRVLARDRRTGKLVTFRMLPDGRFAIDTQVDVEPILEQNKDLQNLNPTGWKGDQHMVASIPMHIHQKMRTEGMIQDTKWFKRWLNDPDNRGWRTKLGRV